MSQELELLLNLKERMSIIEKNLIAQKVFWTFDELATYLGVKIEAVYALTSSNKIPVYKPNGKIGYVKQEEVLEWIESGRISSAMERKQKLDDHLIKR